MTWISVKERLPEEGNLVLIWVPKTRRRYIAWIVRGEWTNERGTFSADAVSHWQPLPAPPTGETE